MKHARHIGFILAAMLLVVSFTGASAIAQQDELAALDKKVRELYQAAKFSEAIPLAQRALAIRERALGPDHPGVAQSLNSLAKLYDDQRRYPDATPSRFTTDRWRSTRKRSVRTIPMSRRRSTTWLRSTTT